MQTTVEMKTFSIGEVSEMTGLPASTLRYYDKQGLFPNMPRENGIRRFSAVEIEALRVIECLKRSGLEIKDIRQFMQWCSEGSHTVPQRLELFEKQRVEVERKLAELRETMDMLNYKCWYYGEITRLGADDKKRFSPDEMPEEVRRAFENMHK